VLVNSSAEVSSISGRLSLGAAARTFNVADGPQADRPADRRRRRRRPGAG
jgi:hypothetical protein